MLTPIMNDYYSDKEYHYALEQMYRMMEHSRIQTMAMILTNSKKATMQTYKAKVSDSVQRTKLTIQAIEEQMDTAFKGQVQRKIEQVVSEKSSQYDKI